MCIIIHKPTGIELPEDVYRECFRMHDDGAGIAYVDPDKNELIVEKGFMNIADALKAIRAQEKKEMLIHFRKISRGPANKDNCHPFTVDVWDEDKIEIVQSPANEKGEVTTTTNKVGQPRFMFAIAHNGTLDIKPEAGWSDTRTFVVKVLGEWLECDPYLFDHQFKRFVIEGFCGPRNKLVIMRYDTVEKQLETFFINKNATMCNENLGCWFSNYTWITPTRYRDEAFEDWDGYGGELALHGFRGTYHQKGLAASTGTNGGVSGSFYESKPDHIGWLWDDSLKMFKNVLTNAHKKELGYRRPGQTQYTFEGVFYDRLARTPSDNGWYKHPSWGDLLEKQKPGDSPNPTEGGNEKSIVVPREKEVMASIKAQSAEAKAEDAWELELKRNRAIRNGDISHWTKKSRNKFVRACVDYVAATLPKDAIEGLTHKDCVSYVRVTFLEVFKPAPLDIAKLDELIMDYLKNPAKYEEATAGQ